jgi:glycosyltransferase involved in cell wall biosynthesis
MPSPTVSVIVPVHNAEAWVATALRSLLAQRNVQTEIIVIDDGSTDGSAQQIEATAKGHPNVLLTGSRENRGIVAALNHGLDLATGQYIARMDADDLCEPERLVRQLRFLDTTGYDLCGSWFVEFGQGISRRVRWLHEHSAVHASLMFQNTICHPTMLSRREVFQEFRYREEYRLAEEYDLFSRASTRFKLANVPEALLRYRRHPGQASQAKRSVMEDVTRRIRLETLARRGFNPSAEERRLHQLIRAPGSIRSVSDLEGIERWLIKLRDAQPDHQSRSAVASQWIRACIRAAPLGKRMWELFRDSTLRPAKDSNKLANADLFLLSTLRLDYGSRMFDVLRRLGLSN